MQRPGLAATILIPVVLLALVLLLPTGPSRTRSSGNGSQVPAPTPPQVTAQSFTAPLRFEAVEALGGEFLGRGFSYQARFAPTGVDLRLRARSGEAGPRVRMELAGAEVEVRATGIDPLPGRANYFLGSDPVNWRVGVPLYSRIRYEQVYPGIDLDYYGNGRELEFDFLVAPGAEPNRIEMRFDGSDAVRRTADGELALATPAGELIFHKPFSYQVREGERIEVPSRYRVSAQGTIGFDVADLDPSLPLVIDPILNLDLQLGGAEIDRAYAVEIGSDGNLYLAGETFSADFPSVNALKPALTGTGSDIFVTKFSPDGTLIFSTYLGGSLSDAGRDLALDSANNIYITGFTESFDFPFTVGAYQQVAGGGADAFVIKLNADGASLGYSSYLGGSGDENRELATERQGVTGGIVVDDLGRASVTGFTESADFPVLNALQPLINGSRDAFVAKFRSDGSGLIFGTFWGQPENGDKGYDIAVDASSNVYITGSTGFINEGGSTQPDAVDAFVAKFSPSGQDVVYSTIFGGTGTDIPYAIDLDTTRAAYVTGFTDSTDFPVTGSIPQSKPGNAFVAKIGVPGDRIDFATYLGGTNGDTGTGIHFGPFNWLLVTGEVRSDGFPAIKAINDRCATPCKEGFVSVLPSAGAAILMSTYLGSAESGDNTFAWPRDITADAEGNIYIAGYTDGVLVDVNGPDPTTLAGLGTDAFLARIGKAIQFVRRENIALESQSSVVVAVQSDGLAGVNTIEYSTRDLTAVAGEDYVATSGTLTFADGEIGPKVISVPIIDDSIVEDLEHFEIVLTDPTGSGLVGEPSVTRAALIEDDTDLQVQQSVAPDPVTAGSELTITAVVKNLGPHNANDVVLDVTLPATAETVSVVTNRGHCNSTAPVQCTMGTLFPDATGTVTIVAVPVEQGTFTSTAEATHGAGDPNLSDNVATNTVTVNSSVPVLTGLSETSTDGGVSSAKVSILGTGFMLTSQGQWNGTDRVTTFLSASELSVDLTAEDLSVGGPGQFTVFNDGPNGGVSNAISFAVRDFNLTGTPGSASVPAGQTTTFVVSIAPSQGTFGKDVTLACGNLPAVTTCSFSPASVMPGDAGATAQLTIVTTAPLGGSTLPELPAAPGLPEGLGLLLAALAGAGLLARVRGMVRAPRRLAFAGSLVLLFMLSACGGGVLQQDQPSTPIGLHNIQVTGTSGSLTAATVIGLDVRP